jgi:hypothetical protein
MMTFAVFRSNACPLESEALDAAAGLEVYRKEQRSAARQIHLANLTDRVNVINFGLPAVMKLLSPTSPEITMLYLDVTLNDLQRAFELARSKPRHLVPRPKTPITPRAGLDA